MQLSFKLVAIWVALIALTWRQSGPVAAAGLQAGAVALDISPRSLPAIRNGGFVQAISDRVDDPLHARCLVLSSGAETIAITIVDSCMFPTDICDAIKQRVSERTPIPVDRILISATHTHSAPSVMSHCLGSGRDEAYTAYVVPRVAQAIVAAYQQRKPAKIGWSSVDLPSWTHCRRWITRSDRMGIDPFGGQTVRAMMHPGYLNPDYVSPAGPVDPELTVVSVVASDDRPICWLANYSMHYFGGTSGFSADYFGQVADGLEAHCGTDDFVGIMSQGTSGDLHWMDYAQPQKKLSRAHYANQIANAIITTQAGIEHQSDVTLAMAVQRLRLQRRRPDPERLAWAAPINHQRGDRPPRDRREVYAQQAAWIDANPETEVVLQAIRIGDLAITALPNEVYGITGLKLKQQSPLGDTFNLELANGAEGYIPPPEQHRLGGYTTWPARTAGLEVGAEPKIVDAMLNLLETVSGKTRRPHRDSDCPYARDVVGTKPIAYWRCGDIASDRIADATGQHHAEIDGGVALYLDGPHRVALGGSSNHAIYFAGGRLQANIAAMANQYSVEMWICNELPVDSRPVTGYFFCRGVDGAIGAPGDGLGIGGTHANQGRLFVYNGNERQETIAGTSQLAVGRWYHVAMTRRDDQVQVYLDGVLEIDDRLPITYPTDCDQFQIGGRNDGFANFDGRIDEVAIYDRLLTPIEIRSRVDSAQSPADGESK